MPFDPAPQRDIQLDNLPWCPPEAAQALHDLSKRVRRVEGEFWNFMCPGGREDNECGAYGCALGHSTMVPSCVALMETHGFVTTRAFIGDALHCAGVQRSVLDAFFFGLLPHPYVGRPVTPEMVADRIDHWLTTGEIR